MKIQDFIVGKYCMKQVNLTLVGVVQTKVIQQLKVIGHAIKTLQPSDCKSIILFLFQRESVSDKIFFQLYILFIPHLPVIKRKNAK